MSFTDEDLKQLKADMEDYPELLQFKIDALLARLEAAEMVIEGSTHIEVDYPESKCEGCKNMEAWRKAAGK